MWTKEAIEYKQKVIALLHQNPAKLEQELASVKEQLEGITAEDRKKWLMENWDNKQEFGGAMRYRVLVDVLANLFALSFFENTPLQNNEYPMLDVMQRDGQVNVRYVGEANGEVKRQRVDRRAHAMYLLQKLSTDLYQYQLMDLQLGDVREVDRCVSEVSYELGLKIDQLAQTLLDSAALTSNLRKTLNFHKAVVTANIPDKNSFAFSNGAADDSGDGSGLNSKITVEKMKRILDYAVKFSSDMQPDGTPLKVKSLFISTQNKRDIWDFCSLVAGFNLSGATQDPKNLVPFEAKTEIYRSGKLESMFGEDFNIVTRNTLDAGACYVSFNKPAGYYFHKPGMAETLMNEDLNLRRKNTGEVGMSVVHSLVQPAPWTYRYMKVAF